MNEPVITENPLESKTVEEQLAELQGEYAKAISLLRYVKREALQYYRSGNPGRKDAGFRLLQILDHNREVVEANV